MCCIILLEILFLFGNHSVLSSLYSEVAKNDLEESYQIIHYLIENNAREDYPKIFQDTKLRFTLISLTGEVLYDSMNPEEKFEMENHGSRIEVKAALAGEKGFDIRESKTLGEAFAYYAYQSNSKEKEPIVIRVSSSYEKEKSQLRTFNIIQFFFFLLLNIAILFFYKNYLKRELEKKFFIMKRFLESGERQKTSYLSEETWMQQFWVLLKEWQHKNLENIEKLSEEKQTLESLLESLPFFVAFMDATGNIQLKNKVFPYLIQKETSYYLDAFSPLEIIEEIKNCINKKTSYQGIVHLKKQDIYLSLEIQYLSFRNFYCILIRDITEETKRESFQRTFVNDISHELKTPLTNIKGYLIAMEDSTEEERKHFFSIVLENVKRMEQTLQDFFNLSKAEGNVSLQKALFSLEELQERLHSVLSSLLEEKKVKILWEIEKDKTLFLAKEPVITILKNLLENAILYNENDNPVVRLKIEEQREQYLFEVMDNGFGIPIAEQDKIFERFYRIDKSRDRNSGGTGLGLSIVKILTLKLGGKVFIKESARTGTTFSVLLPKDLEEDKYR